VALTPGGRIAGYYPLAFASLLLAVLPAATVKKLPRYPSVPAGRLGDLAVDLGFHGQGQACQYGFAIQDYGAGAAASRVAAALGSGKQGFIPQRLQQCHIRSAGDLKRVAVNHQFQNGLFSHDILSSFLPVVTTECSKTMRWIASSCFPSRDSSFAKKTSFVAGSAFLSSSTFVTISEEMF
jgi:hypothetical protein